MLTVGSLFAGYGGIELALSSVLDVRPAWFVEFDKAPSKVLAHHWPDVPNYGDVTTVDWSTVPPVDIITGGSPCQDLSHAGKRAGMTEGTRSNLWVQMREAINVIRPRLVVWENVRGAFSAPADSALEPCPGCVGDGDDGPVLRALGRVLGDLADLGYDAQWHGLRAADVGACHGRFRVFVLAADARRRPLARLGTAGDGVPVSPERGDRALVLLPTPTTTQRGTDANLDSRDGARANLHNEVAKLLPTPTTEPMTGNGHARNLGKEVQLLAGDRWGQYAEAIARHERAFGRPAPEPTEPGPRGNPRLSARFVEFMMMLPEGHVVDVPGLTRNQALKALGNGVVPPQAAYALRVMLARFAQVWGWAA